MYATILLLLKISESFLENPDEATEEHEEGSVVNQR